MENMNNSGLGNSNYPPATQDNTQNQDAHYETQLFAAPQSTNSQNQYWSESPLFTEPQYAQSYQASNYPAFHQPPTTWQQPAVKTKTNWFLPVIAGVLVGAVIGGLAGASVVAVAGSDKSQTAIDIKGGVVNTAVNAVAKARVQSVVTIEVANDKQQASGSGVVLTEDGYIVTNAHVATLDGAKVSMLRVQFSDGRLLEAKTVGIDPLADLAVLKVDTNGLVPVKFADSNTLNVGDLTVAIGAPLGLPSTVTTGVVSALNRGITVKSSAVPEDTQTPENQNKNGNQWQFDYGKDKSVTNGGNVTLQVIQTDAPINHGNSGGALFDGQGNLIGINVAIATGSSNEDSGSIGLGFSIPANLVKRVTDSLIKKQKPTHGLLGANVSDASSDVKATHIGAFISKVQADSAADKAGLKAGDVVIEIDGVAVADSTSGSALIRTHAGGDKVALKILRNGQEKTIEVTLGTVN